jgi:hypothetical protein
VPRQSCISVDETTSQNRRRLFWSGRDRSAPPGL